MNDLLALKNRMTMDGRGRRLTADEVFELLEHFLHVFLPTLPLEEMQQFKSRAVEIFK